VKWRQTCACIWRALSPVPAAHLGAAGFFVTAVPPPTVPENTIRLRFSVTLHHSEDDLARWYGRCHVLPRPPFI